MKLARKVGATSEIWQVFIRDSSSTTGAGLTGLVYNSASLTAYYHRDTDTTATAITLVTMTVGTFTSSGFKEIDSANMPGWYQFCPPNAALASGAKSCGFHLKGATNMAPLPIEVDLDAQVDLTHCNGTAVTSASGRPEVNTTHLAGTSQTARDIGASVLLSSGTGTGQLDFTSGVTKANVTQYGGSAGTFASGRPEVNMSHIAGSAVSTTTAQIGVNVVQVSGDSVAADNCEAFFDGTGYAGTNNVIPTVTTVTTATNVTTVNGLAAGVITASSIAADAITAAKIADGAIDAATFAAGAITASAIAADAIGASELAADAVTEIAAGISIPSAATIASQVRTELTTELARIDVATSTRLATAGYTAPLDAAGTRTAVGLASANLDTQLSTIDDFLDTEIAAIKYVTDKLDTALVLDGAVYQFTVNALENGPSGSGGSAATIAAAVWDKLRSAHTVAGSFGEYVNVNPSFTVVSGSVASTPVGNDYISTTDMQNRLSVVGYNWVADRDVSGTGVTSEEEEKYVLPAIDYAGSIIDQYISGRTEPAQARAAGNQWLKDRCIDIAVHVALSIAGRTPPESVTEMREFSMELLRQHDAGNVDIPNYRYAYPPQGPGKSTRGPRTGGGR